MRTTMQVSTPEAMRALAHPLRLRLLYQLEIDGHGRAADLAQTLGEPANSVSFHLRTLARAGLVVEAPELARDKRDRVWRNAADSYNIAPGTPGMEVLTSGYTEWFRRAISSGDAEGTLARFLQLPLSADEARELAAELGEVISRWAERTLAAARSRDGVARELHNVITAVGPTDLPRAGDPGETPEPGPEEERAQ